MAAQVLLTRVAEQIEFSAIDTQDGAVRPHPVQADRRILEEVSKLPLTLVQRLFGLHAPRDAPKYEHDAIHASLVVANRSGAVVDGDFCAVSGDEDAGIGELDDARFAQRPLGWISDRLAVDFVDDSKHLAEVSAAHLLLRPAGQGFRRSVDRLYSGIDVGGDHRVADARQGHVQQL